MEGSQGGIKKKKYLFEWEWPMNHSPSMLSGVRDLALIYAEA